MKKNTFAVFVVIICFLSKSLFTMICFAEEIFPEESCGSIIADNVNIRSGPGLNFEIINKLKYGSLVLILGEQLDWYKIALPRKSLIYINEQFIAPENFLRGSITADNINVRAGKSTAFNIVGQLNKNDTVEIIQKFNEWYEIFPYNNCYAWVNKNFVKIIGSNQLYVDAENKQREAIDLFFEAYNFEQSEVGRGSADLNIEAVIQKYKVVIRDFPDSLVANSARMRIENLGQLLKKEVTQDITEQKQISSTQKSQPFGNALAEGKLMESGRSFNRLGTHKLIQGKTIVYFLKSNSLNLNDYVYYKVQVWGKIIEEQKSKAPILEVDYIKKLN
ncbi:MAG: SH3 domain-containing protein [Candidatus Omnitrophica bacterium]|nr:SH3 domain-containing protein [Candidatus Omnitrophota bacterium]